MTKSIDDIDRSILNRIQSDFPTTSRPFDAIAKEIGIPEKDVIRRLEKLKKDGIIRRIGGNFVPEKLGYVSTLCAAKVPDTAVDDFTRVVNRFSGVTHNYLRDNSYNIWFTFIAESMEEIEANLRQISVETGIKQILNLPATKTFKIRAEFKL